MIGIKEVVHLNIYPTKYSCKIIFFKIDNNKIKIVFDEPQRAITKGQSVVMYNGDVVVGGGIIC
ncbi:MAG: aminomethyltransferase beta-barrel domain-containing protein [Peptacetobacter hiranonis]|nr:aminomethyltransferase beta-barrel domain-containing protein [Peptacetobacter hiranonis]